ncbi:PQQ-binding-like beta-propeller repeat protein ['Paenibacillus yunnanensis' Narsing Rao et al. 2020]|uniref:outer membrane protein assembly factor BamB family protein n=1 Tax=Paenibacillus tengchongensis TaxID=2608684 RepID=UPI00124DDA60|nr:PQQ-binding-like beta-propeller repeat protein [Paenibacillus tengchongensis]
MMHRKKVAVIGASLLLTLSAVPAASGVYAEQATFSISNSSYTKVQAPVLKPAWTVPAESSQSAAVLAENGKVFMLQKGGKLAALNAVTGKKLWEFGSSLAPLYIYSTGAVYGMTSGGALYAVSEAGRKLWSAAVSMPKAKNIFRSGNTVYVIDDYKIAAVDAVSGTIKWSATEDSTQTGYMDLVEADGVVLRNFAVSGVLTFPAIYAYDAKTGKKLWSQSRQSMPLAIKDGLVYSVKSLEMLDEDPVNRKIAISVIDLQTGEIKGERQYRWTDSANTDGSFRSGGIHASAFLDGDKLYVHRGKTLAQYDFWNYSPDGKALHTWIQPYSDNEFPLYQVVQNRVLYYNYSSNTLSALKLGNGQIVRVPQGENPASQLDLFGSTVYVGQSDGKFHAYDLSTMNPLFTVNTGSREFLPTLKTGNMLIIRSGGKMHGIKLPASVK